jgi:hypothetical protein
MTELDENARIAARNFYAGSAHQGDQLKARQYAWKLVPVEPTPEMIKAWHNVQSQGRTLREAYSELLAAAPAQGEK